MATENEEQMAWPDKFFRKPRPHLPLELRIEIFHRDINAYIEEFERKCALERERQEPRKSA